MLVLSPAKTSLVALEPPAKLAGELRYAVLAAWFFVCGVLLSPILGYTADIYLADGTLLQANSPAPSGAQPILFVHGHKLISSDPEPHYLATWVQALDSTLRSFEETLGHAENSALDLERYYLNFGDHNRSLVEDARADRGRVAQSFGQPVDALGPRRSQPLVPEVAAQRSFHHEIASRFLLCRWVSQRSAGNHNSMRRQTPAERASPTPQDRRGGLSGSSSRRARYYLDTRRSLLPTPRRGDRVSIHSK